MKKILSLMLCLAVLFGLVGCGNTQDPTVVPDHSNTDPYLEPTNSTGTNNGPKEEEIRENGSLPTMVEELTASEISFYLNDLVAAIMKLDLEKAISYSADLTNIEKLQKIELDPNAKTMWNKTVGSMIYLPESQYFIHKDPDYIFAHWYTDLWRENAALAEDETKLSKDELDAIFNKYYSDAPYVATELSKYNYEVSVKDGKIYFEFNELFSDIYGDLWWLSPMIDFSSGGNAHYYRYVIGDNSLHGNLDYDHISDNGKFTLWQPMMTGDLDEVVKYFDAQTKFNLNDENSDSFFGEVYRAYFKSEQHCNAIEEWMRNNVKLCRDESAVTAWIPATMDKSYPYYTFTDAEKALLEDINITVKGHAFGLRAGTTDEFSLYYDVIEQMIYCGAIEKLY